MELMGGEAIAELNADIKSFCNELQADSLAIKRVEVALLTFGPVLVISEFNTTECFFDPELEAVGDTPREEAIHRYSGHPRTPLFTVARGVSRIPGASFTRSRYRQSRCSPGTGPC